MNSDGSIVEADFLFIGGGFFGYAKEIIAALERCGRRVLWFEDRPATDSLSKITIRLAPSLMAARAEAYFESIINKASTHPITDVLIIKGESLSSNSLRRLRKAFPLARFTIYFWDSYRNMPKGTQQKVALCDKAFTFDWVDAQADTRLKYRPLWFLDEYLRLPIVEQDIDVLFFGTVHTDRHAVLRRLANILPAAYRFEKVMYFPSRLVYAVRRITGPDFWGASSDDFIFEPLEKHAILSLIARSRIVVDIERPVQSGLTMRTIETLGAGRKLITTNETVRHADFYAPSNIAIIDRKRPAIADQFFQQPYLPPPAEMLHRYSLAGWLKEVLDISIPVHT